MGAISQLAPGKLQLGPGLNAGGNVREEWMDEEGLLEGLGLQQDSLQMQMRI